MIDLSSVGKVNGDKMKHAVQQDIGETPDTGLRTNSGNDDPKLTAIVTAWPHLPEVLRAGILAMVKTANGRWGGGDPLGLTDRAHRAPDPAGQYAAVRHRSGGASDPVRGRLPHQRTRFSSR